MAAAAAKTAADLLQRVATFTVFLSCLCVRRPPLPAAAEALAAGEATRREAETGHAEDRREDPDAGEAGVGHAGAQMLARQLVLRRGPPARPPRGGGPRARDP